MTYPTYYRQNNWAVKRIDEVTSRVVEVPIGSDKLPLKMFDIKHVSKEFADLFVSNLELVSEEEYIIYVSTFTSGARVIGEDLSAYKQRQYENQNTKL
jgi:hypothetical protein